MKATFKLGLIFIATLSVSACDSLDLTSDKGVFHYSNPTTKNITFKVDGESHEILPGGKGNIKISSGMHKLENSAGQVFSFMVFDNNNGGIINPDNHVYYTLSEAYAVEGKSNKFKPATYDVTINGHELEMSARSANATIIDANMFKCSYQLGEPFPDSITINDRSSNGNIKSKCFDKIELIDYISTTYKEDLKPESPKDEGNDSINMTFNYDIPTVKFLHADMQEKADAIVVLLKQLKESDDAGIHDKVNKNITQLSIDLVSVYAKHSSSLSKEEHQKYDDFIRHSGYFQTYGILGK
ncbi:hypothetical protein [Pectobacterium wasabiae]|uniref:Lipoprotein n=1 Tax=Pectobacterium wasabiae TaxID=55208 RepID=A0AAW3ED82_9GAMM|nr:hypothetical protein [Pectobacterium wasabiae]AOR63077.1 hypothetical protein A7983_07375 [Pectobacterium wasabiae CFBP 3304]EJS92157.1 Hypothetical protein Y17_4656 [Pectobacterium wasabiae CFBP 3304]KFX03671.1 lipoprotein [Pectobacterium wasabiae]KGA27022.1 lipoprotein [Pectobacterium wasabiae]